MAIGDWTIEKNDSIVSGFKSREVGIYREIEGGTKICVATIDTGWQGWEANARLIAAAPKMLEELTALKELWEDRLNEIKPYEKVHLSHVTKLIAEIEGV